MGVTAVCTLHGAAERIKCSSKALKMVLGLKQSINGSYENEDQEYGLI